MAARTAAVATAKTVAGVAPWHWQCHASGSIEDCGSGSCGSVLQAVIVKTVAGVEGMTS